MLNRLRQGASDESGFTLIELLVVILIIGILAAIAIPTFLNQTSKANDASAESLVKNAQTEAASYATDHEGNYKGLTPTKVEEYEKTIKAGTGGEGTVAKPAKCASSSETCLIAAEPVGTNETGYAVEAEAENTKDTFEIEVNESGTEVRECKATKEPTGCVSDKW